jgi:hypothetical protein
MKTRGNARRLGFEELERRTLLAGNVTAALQEGVLVITGDNVSNFIQIRQLPPASSTGEWSGARYEVINPWVPKGDTPTLINGQSSVIVEVLVHAANAGIFRFRRSCYSQPVSTPVYSIGRDAAQKHDAGRKDAFGGPCTCPQFDCGIDEESGVTYWLCERCPPDAEYVLLTYPSTPAKEPTECVESPMCPGGCETINYGDPGSHVPPLVMPKMVGHELSLGGGPNKPQKLGHYFVQFPSHTDATKMIPVKVFVLLLPGRDVMFSNGNSRFSSRSRHFTDAFALAG